MCLLLAQGIPDSKLAGDRCKQLKGLILLTAKVLGGLGASWMSQEGCSSVAILERVKKKNTFNSEGLQGWPQSGAALTDFTAPVKGRGPRKTQPRETVLCVWQNHSGAGCEFLLRSCDEESPVCGCLVDTLSRGWQCLSMHRKGRRIFLSLKCL